MKKIKIFSSIAMVLLLAGCTSKSTGPLFSYSPSGEERANVYHYRVPSIVGNAQNLILYMNNSFVTIIDNGGYFQQSLLPGTYKFEIKRQIGNKTVEIKERNHIFTVTVKPDKSYFFKWNVSLSKDEHLEIVKKATGLTEMKGLRLFSSGNFVFYPGEKNIVQTPITWSDPGRVMALVPYEPIEIRIFKNRVIGVRKQNSNDAFHVKEIICNCDLIKDSNKDGVPDEYLIKNKKCRIYTANGVLEVDPAEISQKTKKSDPSEVKLSISGFTNKHIVQDGKPTGPLQSVLQASSGKIVATQKQLSMGSEGRPETGTVAIAKPIIDSENIVLLSVESSELLGSNYAGRKLVIELDMRDSQGLIGEGAIYLIPPNIDKLRLGNHYVSTSKLNVWSSIQMAGPENPPKLLDNNIKIWSINAEE